MDASIDFVRRIIPETSASFEKLSVGPPGILIHADGTNGTTYFTDAYGRHNLQNIGGTVDTSIFKFGNASMRCNASGDTLHHVDNTYRDFDFGLYDFTIDFFLNANTLPISTADPIAIVDVSANIFAIFIGSDGSVGFYYNGTQIQSLPGLISAGTNTWNHIALTRAENITKLFLSGSQVGITYVDFNNYGNLDPTLGFPHFGDACDTWMDEIHILKGTAIWTSNFTPPTSPYSP